MKIWKEAEPKVQHAARRPSQKKESVVLLGVRPPIIRTRTRVKQRAPLGVRPPIIRTRTRVKQRAPRGVRPSIIRTRTRV